MGEELQELAEGVQSIRLWLQTTLNVPPSRDQQLVAIHNLGSIEGRLLRLEQTCSQSADADSKSDLSTHPQSETSLWDYLESQGGPEQP